MIQRAVFIATFVVWAIVYSLPVEEKIEPVELFHICREPKNGDIDPDKSPVVLLHGLFATHESFEGVDQRIADRSKRKVCSVDLRNHGDSPWNNRSDIAAFTEDLDHFLKMQNIKNVNIIGESLGGKIAMHYALKNPHEVDSIIIEDMRPNTVTQRAILGLKLIGRLIKKIIEIQPKDMDENQAMMYVQHYIEKISKQVEAYQKVPDGIIKFFKLKLVDGKWTLKHNMEAFYEGINNINKTWTESTGLYTGPALFLYGIDSVFKVGEDKENIFKLFPNAKLVPVSGLGHIIHQNEPDFDSIVVKFLDGIN